MKRALTIPEIKLEFVPVMSIVRGIPRKEQAWLARKLFKELGIKGVSVTAENYANASSVLIQFRSPNQDRDRRTLEGILAKAFPNHDDRSDVQSDYFDFCWSYNIGPALQLAEE